MGFPKCVPWNSFTKKTVCLNIFSYKGRIFVSGKSTDLVIPIYPIVISSINSVPKMYLVQLDIEKISLIVSLSFNV